MEGEGRVCAVFLRHLPRRERHEKLGAQTFKIGRSPEAPNRTDPARTFGFIGRVLHSSGCVCVCV